MRDHTMKKHTKIVLGVSSLALGLGILTYAVAAQADEGRHGGHHGGPMKLFEEFDTNGDGKVTRAEADAVIKKRHETFDTDKSGSLTQEEFTNLFAEMMRDRIASRFFRLDANDDGVLDAGELSRPAGRMIAWMDDDEDGAVTIKEIKEGMKNRRKHD